MPCTTSGLEKHQGHEDHMGLFCRGLNVASSVSSQLLHLTTSCFIAQHIRHRLHERQSMHTNFRQAHAVTQLYAATMTLNQYTVSMATEYKVFYPREHATKFITRRHPLSWFTITIIIHTIVTNL